MGFLKTAVQNWLGLTNQNIKGASTHEELSKRIYNLNIDRDLYEYYLWYTANSNKLINYYRFMHSTPGKRDYFWRVTADENNKKTHSGVPKMIVDSIANVTGIPTFSTNEEEIQNRIDDIVGFNDYTNIIKQDIRPKTLVIGGGVIFVSDLSGINEGLDLPVIEFIDERYCDIEMIGNIFVAATKKTIYKYNKTFIHYERRSYNLVENWLYCEEDKKRVPLTTIKDTAHLEEEIKLNINCIAAIPVRYKNGEKFYGQSIFSGKLDLFDDYDQTCSQLSEVIRKSTPVTYIPGERIPKGKDNNPTEPREYDKKFIILAKSNKQESDDKVITEQPSLQYDGLINAGVTQLIQIMSGILSPATLGIEVAANNNAEAMREKEKVTLVTRDDIIDNEKNVNMKVIELALKIEDYMKGKSISEYEINVDYPEFSTPTFDAIVATMLPMWSANAISPEQFVKKLYGNDLSEKEIEEEIEYLTKDNGVTDYNFFGDVEPYDKRTDGATQTAVDDIEETE